MTVDTAEIVCGPATQSVRALVALFREIAWFAPSPPDRAAPQAWVEEHLRLVRKADPAAIPEHVEIAHHVGGWSELQKLAERVRMPRATYDWKFGVLKPLAKAHSRRRGWTMEGHARAYQGPTHAPGDMILMVGAQGVWNVPTPRTDFSHAGAARDDAGWYYGFAVTDLIEAVEWQLAEASDELADNPFVPLLRTYASGAYPFALAPDRISLLHFGERGA